MPVHPAFAQDPSVGHADKKTLSAVTAIPYGW